MGKGLLGLGSSLLLTLTLQLVAAQWLPLSASAASIKAQNGVVTMELWCVAKNNAEDSALQRALDWACGPGGADCGPIQQGGPCYDASDVQSTASFAFNSYYLKNGMTDDSCNFDNTAAITSLNPSHDNCKFPSR
ncbi:X8 domain containing protein [Parasponia andersonii]|uniref:X8 domain containing protein n=1 Tax=Parasponia andersonii TaxID=3476 RepID=A0A2P5AZI0_PARAD|nr:X8 domain containing protein [Parasponia andersonii]